MIVVMFMCVAGAIVDCCTIYCLYACVHACVVVADVDDASVVDDGVVKVVMFLLMLEWLRIV